MSVPHSDDVPPMNVEYSRRDPSGQMRATNESHPTLPPPYTRLASSGSMAKTPRFVPSGPVACHSRPPSSVMPEPYAVATYATDGSEAETVTLITGNGRVADHELPPSAV